MISTNIFRIITLQNLYFGEVETPYRAVLCDLGYVFYVFKYLGYVFKRFINEKNDI